MSRMWNSRLWGKITVLVGVCGWCLSAQAKYDGGSGTQAEPFRISSVPDWQELMATPADWESYFVLTADIDLNDVPITPVGSDPNKFAGVFDGNDYVIRDADVNMPDSDYVGLFGYLGTDGEIKNLGVEDISVFGRHCVGGLVGGSYYYTSITNCYSTGSVSGDEKVGGLVGLSYDYTSITNCYSTGSVSGTADGVGGLVGANYGTISNCYSSGSVSGTGSYVGGLVGVNRFCHPGGCSYGMVAASFWDTQTSGLSTSAGGTGLTTGEMQTESTFSCWGADGVWTIDEGNDYPRLWWENAPGHAITRNYYYGGGTGTQTDPYLIYTPEQLDMIGLIACDWDRHFKLMADIDLSGFDGKDGRPAFNIIGPGEVSGYWYFIGTPFTGVLDGNGHRILHLPVTVKDNGCGGLIGGLEGEVKDLGIVDVNITSSGAYIGGLVGHNHGTISNCYSTGTVNGEGYVGGMVGLNYGKVTQCHSTAAVSGTSDVGGLVGGNGGTISNCYSTGSVNGEGYVGGLLGSNGSCHMVDGWSGDVTNCYSAAVVIGNGGVGGLVGSNDCGSITASYSTGAVTGTGSNVGGLVGYYSWKDVGCFWDTETSRQATSAGGTPKTTAEMKTQSTFTSAGWDFVGETINGPNDIWRMCVDAVQYPLLSWQFIPDFTCPDGVDILDLAFFVDRWLADCDETNNFCNCTDINHDAQVDFGDFAFFSRHWLEGVIPQDMVLIPGGTFQMGDNLGGGYSERPVHTVRLDSFYMGKYEITNQQYCAFLNWADDNGWITVTSGVVYKAGSGTSYPYCDTSTLSSYSQIAYGGGLFSVRTKGGRSMVNDPMVKVSWYGAAAYCNWRSLQEGRDLCYYPSTLAPDPSKHGYRLATEAEWEYAARGGLAGRRFPWGDTISHSQANYYSSGDYAYDVSPTRSYHPAWDDILPYTSPVGSFPVTGYGLYDMAGNVLEWCNDWYQWNYYTGRPNPDVNPTGPATGTTRVVRGGGWGYNAPRDCYCRVASRSYLRAPPDRSYSIGFRLVLDF